MGVGGGSGSVCVAWKKGLSVSLINEKVWETVFLDLPQEDMRTARARMCAVVLLCPGGVKVTLVELHLHHGEELMSEANVVL